MLKEKKTNKLYTAETSNSFISKKKVGLKLTEIGENVGMNT